ncbi:MAG: hypothetical protein WDN06_17935 [Asticcacaulis sp.]
MTTDKLKMKQSFAYGLKGKVFVGMSLLALTATLGLGATYSLTPTVAHAQIFGDDDDDKDDPNQVPTNSTVWDAKRLQQLDRDVRKLERSVARVQNKASPPILIEPDPEVVALQATVDTLSRKQDEQTDTIAGLTSSLEEAQHQNQLLQQQVNGLVTRLDGMSKRIDMTDAHLKDIDGLPGAAAAAAGFDR